MWVDFHSLDPSARIWVYTLKHSLSSDSAHSLEKELHHFCEHWQAHQVPLTCSFTLIRHKFLVIGVNQNSEKPSGCSIDALFQLIHSLEKKHGITFLPNSQITFQDKQQGIFSVDYAQVHERKFATGTLIFDNTISTKKQLENGWQIPIEQSWLHNAP